MLRNLSYLSKKLAKRLTMASISLAVSECTVVRCLINEENQGKPEVSSFVVNAAEKKLGTMLDALRKVGGKRSVGCRKRDVSFGLRLPLKRFAWVHVREGFN